MSAVTKFQCLGKNKNGERCKNKIITCEFSGVLTCDKHRDQNVTFQYSSVKGPCKLHDIAKLIAIHIDDSKTFANFAKVCLSCAKSCHELQNIKKKQFVQEREIYGVKIKMSS